MPIAEKELEILNTIYSSDKQVHQRELADRNGMSLGMTNAIVKRLVTKGFLMMRKVNNRNIQYIVSPEGIDAIARRSYRYFRRTIQNVAKYKETLKVFLEGIKKQGFYAVTLIGKSDVDFIVEYLCGTLHLTYHYLPEAERVSPETFLLYSESLEPPGGAAGAISLRQVLTGYMS